MPSWLVMFIVVDLLVIGAIVFLVFSGRLKLDVNFTVKNGGTDFRALMAFTREKHARIGEYLRANWSGGAEQLPQVLESLLAELERDAQARGMTVDHDIMKSILASSVRAHRIVPSRDLGNAIERVA